VEGLPFLLAWPTAGRRACLVDSVAGFVANAAEHGRAVSDVLVASDGAGEGLEAGVAAGLAELEQRYGFSSTLSNQRTRRAEIADLSVDFEPEVLEYALLPCPDGPGWGVNVNAAMLAGAGGLLVSCDDDVFCRPARPAKANDSDDPRFSMSTEYHVGELDYHDSRESLLSSMRLVDVDIVGRYRAVLGMSAGELAGDGAWRDDDAPVMVASPGMYGDSAMGGSRTALSLVGAARERLMAGPYERLRLSRELVRVAPRPTLSPGTQLIMTQTGFDDRSPPPPFLPFGRNPDGLCAVLTRLVYPASLTAYLDFGLLHAPPEPRVAVRADLTSYRVNLAELVMALVIANRPAASVADPAERFRRIAAALVDAAAFGNSALVDALHGSWAPQLGRYVERLEVMLDTHDREPAAWAADVGDHIDAVNAMLREPSALFGAAGCGLSIDGVRRHLRLYGTLLACWPELHARHAAPEK